MLLERLTKVVAGECSGVPERPRFPNSHRFHLFTAQAPRQAEQIGLQLPYGGESRVARQHLDVALTSWLQGDLASAQRELQAAQQAAPDWPLVRYQLAVVASASGEFALASTLLQDIGVYLRVWVLFMCSVTMY